jgi:hypothetical protein
MSLTSKQKASSSGIFGAKMSTHKYAREIPHVQKKYGDDEGQALAVSHIGIVSRRRYKHNKNVSTIDTTHNEYALSTLKRFSCPIPCPSMKKSW